MTSPLWWYSTLGNVQCRLRSQTMKPEIEADVSHGGGNLSPSIQLPICKNTNTLIYEYINTQNKISFVSHREGNLSPLIVHFNILSVQSTQRIKKKSSHGIPGPGWIKRTIKLVSELLMRCWCIYSIRNNQAKKSVIWLIPLIPKRPKSYFIKKVLPWQIFCL